MAKKYNGEVSKEFIKLIATLKQQQREKLLPENPQTYQDPDDVPDRVWHQYWDSQVTIDVKPLLHFPHG